MRKHSYLLRPSQMIQPNDTPHGPSAKPDVAHEPSHEDIARWAYDIYVSKGRRQGECKRNWEQAEQVLRAQARAAFALHRGLDDSSAAQSATS